MNLLVVCMGNICRSPTAEAVLRYKADQLGINMVVDSAGTIGYHQGNPPDPRSVAVGEARGYDFSGIQSRQVRIEDFTHFDLIIAADANNLADLKRLCPSQFQHKLSLFLSYSDSHEQEIPDPYYGGENGFDRVLDLIEQASDQLLQQLMVTHPELLQNS